MSLINNRFKIFLITLLSLTLLFLISCSDAYKPSGEDGTRTLSYYAGDWWVSVEGEEQRFLTINADGSVIIYGDPDTITIPSTDITKNSDTSYTYYDATEHAGMDFNFTSDTKGTVVDNVGTLHITKK